MGKFKDLTGMRFGKLEVICREGTQISPNGNKSVLWKCLCDCQLNKPENERNYTYVITNNLTKEKGTHSCGCYIKEFNSKNNSKKNIYDLTQEYGIGYTYNTDEYGRNEFYFDLEDYDKIKDYCWYFGRDNYLWAHAHIFGSDKKIEIHKIIMSDLDNNYDIDHIHGDKTRNDNRKSNLRYANRSQNNSNRKLMSNNTSGATGICWRKDLNKWQASIVVNKKKIHLGYFLKKEDAIKARKIAEEKYFGEFSYDNSQAM